MSTFHLLVHPQMAAVRRAERAMSLTSRQLEIVALVVDGRTTPEIADALEISPRTVQSHLAAVMDRLQVRSRTELAVVALRRGLVPLHPVDAHASTPVQEVARAGA